MGHPVRHIGAVVPLVIAEENELCLEPKDFISRIQLYIKAFLIRLEVEQMVQIRFA